MYRFVVDICTPIDYVSRELGDLKSGSQDWEGLFICIGLRDLRDLVKYLDRIAGYLIYKLFFIVRVR